LKSKENITPKKNVTGQREANLINPETIASLKEEIQYLWEIYRIDRVYREVFTESMSKLPPKMCIQILAKEIENLYNEKATIQQIFMSIQQREDCINTLKDLIQDNSITDKKMQVITLFHVGNKFIREATHDVINGY
jgi:anaerobic ribonucleoside-triphosphate reductase